MPLKKWLQTDLADWTRELLLDSPVTAGELFEASTIETILDEHTSGHRNHTGRIYTLIVFELWHRCHVAGASTSLPQTGGVAAQARLVVRWLGGRAEHGEVLDHPDLLDSGSAVHPLGDGPGHIRE